MATQTNKLKLYVYNVGTDGTLYFSVREAITENFQKVDNFAIDVYDKLDRCLTRTSIASDTQLGGIKVGNNLSIDENGVLSASNDIDEERVQQLIDTTLSKVSGKKLGELVITLEPSTDTSLLLLDGRTIALDGEYSDFIQKYIDTLYEQHPERFKTLEEWDYINNTYGTCAYYVYNTEDNELKLPNLCGMVEFTSDLTKGGEITEAGLPNITGSFSGVGQQYNTNNTGATLTGAFYRINTTDKPIEGVQIENGSDKDDYFGFDASLSNFIYGNSDTVQPQTTKMYCYIVVANGGINTDISQIQFENIVNDFNNLTTKLDKKIGIESDSHSNINEDNGYIVFESGMTIQWGKLTSQTTVTFQKPFINTNYSFFINPVVSGLQYTYTETNKQPSFISFARGSSQPCYWLALGISEI